FAPPPSVGAASGATTGSGSTHLQRQSRLKPLLQDRVARGIRPFPVVGTAASYGCNKNIISWRHPVHALPGPSESPMNAPFARLTLLALSTALFTTACSSDSPAPGQAFSAEASTAAASGERVSTDVSGAGASFIFPLVSKWSADYNAATGAKINYQSIGSGGGIAQIKAGTVDFGSSAKPLSSEELAQAGLGQFPSAIGGVVPVVNLEGLAPGQLKLTGPVLADIFLGKIGNWNDPAIAALNAGTTLPDGKISIVHRSDGSGTTFNFSNYLSKLSPAWKAQVGEGTSLQWPSGVG